ncbi:MAG: FtsX-like permease family protein [Sediminimonas qiaohouensis]|uniref:FtsX-like permease family protein n=1 Tax=Sediminimonas qiaohouensis TaxID=552061 RepID=A0A7C9LBE2_9RHOB|nr:ABC transporter permease [Sediminimonas qiaohouensis]MTJ05118.1 FtsX-like permease family protein [Sediminimonas qiaohouensis]
MVAPLDRKLLRGLWRIKGQAGAIALVIGLGVLMQVMMTGLVNTLDETRLAYYDRYRLADVFVPVTRAPERMAERLASDRRVAAATTRIKGQALIDPGEGALPIRAQALSLPDAGTPRLNDIYLAEGRLPRSASADEIVLLTAFAKARGIAPGDSLDVTMNGARHSLRIVGLARAPEFLYTTAPGELVPDDARFAVFWMRRTALAAAYDLRGAFNEMLLKLERGTNPQAIIDVADRTLAPFGATGAYGLADLPSNRFVTEEIRGLTSSATTVPPIFLGIAAFLLYIVVARIVQAEREQIGLLKAFGYSGAEVSLHYLKLVVLIAVVGAVAGSIAGISAGHALAVFYQTYFKFPFLVFTLDPISFVTGFAISILAATMGGLAVVRHVFALTPAVAMRPPAPPDYSRTFDLAGVFRRVLDQPSRMVLRRLSRYPGRMLGSVVGIAAGMALSASTLTVVSGFTTAVDLSFTVMNRSDMTVMFTHPVPRKTLLELRRMDGVQRTEPLRIVPAILRNGTNTYRGTLEGRPQEPALNRIIDANEEPLALRGGGITLAEPLADILKVRTGDMLYVEVREGRRPVLHLPVTAVAQTLLGAPAFMEIDALGRALNEPGRISGALLTIDSASRETLYQAIKDMPAVAGVTLKADARTALVDLMNTGPGSVRYVMLLVAAIITFGIVYNAARIAFAERSRDLASLRVMGFTRAEAGFVLLGELAIVTLLAIPLGIGLGYGLTWAIVEGFSTDLYQIPVVFHASNYGAAILAVVIAATVSAFLVWRNLTRLDLVSALKTRD